MSLEEHDDPSPKKETITIGVDYFDKIAAIYFAFRHGLLKWAHEFPAVPDPTKQTRGVGAPDTLPTETELTIGCPPGYEPATDMAKVLANGAGKTPKKKVEPAP